MWHPDDYLKAMIGGLELERKRKSSSDRLDRMYEPWEVRRKKLADRLEVALGSFAEPGGLEVPLAPEQLEAPVETDGIVRERVLYSTADGLRVPAYVLKPAFSERVRLPAVLAWHGHGDGSREAVGLHPDGSPKAPEQPGIHGRFAVELARRGLLVLVPEIIGFGDRKVRWDMEQNPGTPNSCFPIAAALLMAGKSIAGLRTYEARRAADYLGSRADVDPARIGSMGFSGGGMIASLSAALDTRIRATVLCGYPNTYASSILARRHCLDNYIPDVLTFAEMPDLLSLIAPRSLFVESGTMDHLFPVGQVEETIAALKEHYRSLQAEERLEWDIFEGKHEISGRKSYDWLASSLKAM